MFTIAIIAVSALAGTVNVWAEEAYTLAQLAKKIPRARPVAPSTIHRWRHPGLHGIRLECTRVGGVWYSSIEALQRFFAKLTDSRTPPLPQGAAPDGNSAVRRHRRHQEAIERELKDLGA